MKIFHKDLRDQAMKIINYEKKEMMPLTNEEKESYEKQRICYICKKEFCTDKNNEKEFKLKKKLEITVIIQENLEELLIVFAIYAIKYQKSFLQYFIMDLHMIIIL